MTPRVSVIIPAYNAAGRLGAAIDSALAQTYRDFEVVVVDDGSTDETPAILASFGDRIVRHRQANRGASAARNTAMGLARGEFFAFLDADDTWDAEKLERQMPRFADPLVGVVYSDFRTRFADGTERPSFLAGAPLAGEGDVLEQYVQSRFLLPSASIVRRECVEAFGGFNERLPISHDVDLFGRIFTRWHAARVSLPLTTRYEGDANLTRNRLSTTRDTIAALCNLEAMPALKTSVRRALARELGRQYWWLGYAEFRAGLMGDARENLLQAMRRDGSMAATCFPVYLLTLLPEGARTWLRSLRATGTA